MTRMTRIAATGLTATVVAALAVAGAGTANAAPNQYAPSIGTARGSLLTGGTGIPFSMVTSSLCPAGTGNINAFVNSTDAGLVDAVAISTNSTEIDVANTSGIPMNDNLLGVASAAGKVLVNGRYELSVVCYPDAFSDPTAQFDAVFNVTGGASATAPGTTFAFEVPAAPSSTTNLAVTPGTQANAGDTVTLTATVTSTAAVAGTVQFKDGGTNLGAPVAVAGGTATLTTTTLPAGNRSLTAEFIPANPTTVQGSTSAAVTYRIVAPAQATTTTLTSSTPAPTSADAVSLTATVAPAGATGTVTFKRDGATVGSAAVAGGTASVSLAPQTAGTYAFTAEFTSSDTASYLNSVSAPFSITVTAFAGATASEEITTTVPAGQLTITAETGVVDLGTLELSADATRYQTVAPVDLRTVTVSDRRAGSRGWNVSGQVTDFTGGEGGTDQINSGNLGWTPRVISTGTGQTVNAGPAVATPATPIARGAATTEGLKVSRQLASSPAGSSVGTAELTAALRLIAPTTTTAGVFNATLTLTAI